MNQDTIFWDGEGDGWYERNKQVLAVKNDTGDPIMQTIEQSGLSFSNILEVGASNGFRLHLLHKKYGCPVTAVEPSAKAIAEGKKSYPEVAFHRGTAAELPSDLEGMFDLVVVNFVLHWVDRKSPFRSVANIDAMLADRGHLVVGDFYPEAPQRTAYHHLPGQDVWTYKQNYAELFTATRLYQETGFEVFAHDSRQRTSDADPDNRAFVSVLRKDLVGGYPIRSLD